MARLRRAAEVGLFHTGRTADRVARVSHYLAIGTCQLAELRENIRRSWDDFYANDGSLPPRLLDWEESVVERRFPPGSGLLVIGCGSGRDLIALAKRGCRVTGVEPAARAVRLARIAVAEHQIPADIVEGFFEDAPIEGAFDGVIFSYYSYACIPVTRRRTEALRKAAGLLSSGGCVVISHAANLARPRRYLVRLGRAAGCLCGSDWRLEDGDVVGENRRARPSYSYTHAFGPGELEREAAGAGLHPVATELATDGSLVAVLERS